MNNLELLIPTSADSGSNSWATVTQASPLRIKLDGDTDALPFTPDALVSGLAVNDRVRVELATNNDPNRQARRVIVIGRAGGGIPPGMLMPYAGSTAPAGWLLCDGAAVSRTTYAALFGICSTTYGSGDGSTTFNLPNLKGRVPVGRDSGQTEFDSLGESGGAKTHTLTAAEMPSHTHDLSGMSLLATANAAGGSSADNGGTSIAQGGTTGRFSHDQSGGGTTTSAGSGNAHSILQPYLVINYVIKT